MDKNDWYIFSGGGGDGDPASDQGWSNKFDHCQNPYFGKSEGAFPKRHA